MGSISITFTCLLVFALGVLTVCDQSDSTDVPTASRAKSNPLATVVLDRNVHQNFKNSDMLVDGVLSRVKRQYGYDPYYRRRYPPVIFGGGGFGRSFGGRGFGGRGFGGRGIGGRGIGGRGGGGGHGGRG